ncbi:hypothetical protein P280DRAFT_477537 [Massarina eburnea CBS 473.64]|uniref:Uncharacterized protein n=1 Tax=Massarina eburnea CBS 473.64 TaxID=1395130 RepID=A0A6A6SA63_9PLEO|nr:hypothetical protein P280DRAFT_477537 [Massarina eburnea CBS 473.64]
MSSLPSSRSPITILLILLGTLAIFYQLFASFPTLGDSLYSVLPTSSTPSCIKDIGDHQCCSLFMQAEPCVEECRKVFVDRETQGLTVGFDACSERCLAIYDTRCGAASGAVIEGLLGAGA